MTYQVGDIVIYNSTMYRIVYINDQWLKLKNTDPIRIDDEPIVMESEIKPLAAASGTWGMMGYVSFIASGGDSDD